MGDTVSDYILYMSTAGDTLPDWYAAPRERDLRLREFWPTEPILAGAIYSTVSRYAGFEWELDGPAKMMTMYERILHSSEHGRGWQAMMIPFLLDVFTQDNGGFLELVRTDDNPNAPVIQINHLDSFACQRTGLIETPVLFTDVNNNRHLLKWYHVLQFCEMPSPDQRARGRQYCAVSRVLRAAQLMRDTNQYKRERATGQDSKQIHVVSGVGTNKIDEAIDTSRQVSAAQGYARYTRPVIIGSLDPTARAGVATIDLAKLPDGYDEEKAQRDYITIVAMCLGIDYQDIAPLPSSGMGGGSAGSETLAIKARGKGPRLFMSGMEYLFNYHGVLPRNVTFAFGDQDASEDLDRTKLRAMRAEERAMRIKSGEISPEVARLLARDAGDLDEDYLPMLENYVPAEVQIAQQAADAKAQAASNDPSGDVQAGRSRVKKQEGGTPAASTRTA